MQTDYDIAFIGGGLAGLSASILLARLGHKVVLFEKETYPFHRVCGEYISMESHPFLASLGLPLDEMRLPRINTLLLTTPGGKAFTTRLPLGGFGISRYLLDGSLAAIAEKDGVIIRQQTKVEDVKQDEHFHVHYAGALTTAKLVCGSFGKRSNLDVKWNRPFTRQQNNRLNNYIGVKYHVRTDWPDGVIGLHNFTNGYCGISKIEDEKFCVCYMTKARNLKANGNNIAQMQEAVLFQNPHLRNIFSSAIVEPDFPLTISQISFNGKPKTERGLPMLGDAAGMITPLCGNGMSIALHTGKIAAELIHLHLKHKGTLAQLQKNYERQWQRHFAMRLKAGRLLQSFFGSNSLSNFLVGTVQTFPFIATPLIRLTHGKTF
jgi:flavin-dependent dehydrogenase